MDSTEGLSAIRSEHIECIGSEGKGAWRITLRCGEHITLPLVVLAEEGGVIFCEEDALGSCWPAERSPDCEREECVVISGDEFYTSFES